MKALKEHLSELRLLALRPPADIVDRFAAAEERFVALSQPVSTRLLESPLAWTQEENEAAAWISHTARELAAIGYRAWERLASDPADPRARHFAIRTLLHMGDAVKWHGVVRWDDPPAYHKPHAIMRFAMKAGIHRDPVHVVLPERVVDCTVEALYFRALLLARFSSGSFKIKQLEILDQWMWLWSPILRSAEKVPAGGAFRADLDSNEGLRPGARHHGGTSLYLPVMPIQRAYVEILRQFHAGRIVPSEGIASRFRIEEHVAVLELARRGLRGIAATPLGRAERGPRSTAAELVVGLGAIQREGFARGDVKVPRTSLSLATVDGLKMTRDARVAVDGTYDRARRMVRIANASATGFGIEAPSKEVDGIGVGDIVALRVAPATTPAICKVSRRSPVPGSDVVMLGLKRLASRPSVVQLQWPESSPERERMASAIYVPSPDANVHRDAWLVSEREFARRPTFQVRAGGQLYAMQLDRVCDRGPGWILAGFRVLEQKAA